MSYDEAHWEWVRRIAAENKRLNGPPGGSRFFHGGPEGLAVGTRILPPSVTGALQQMEDGRLDDLVHIATDPALALIFTNRYHPGAVYAVEPQGRILPDDEHLLTDVAWMCESAVILGIEREGMTSTERGELYRARHAAIAYIKRAGIESLEDSDRAIVKVLRENWVTVNPAMRSALIRFCGGQLEGGA